MVTRSVIRITPEEVEASTAASAAKASSSAATVDSSKYDDNTPTKERASEPTHPKLSVTLCNHSSCTKRAQHPSTLLCWEHGAEDVICNFIGCNKKGILYGLCPDHGGLVQLCRWRGCINKVDLEKRGGLCRLHQVKGGEQQQSDLEDEREVEIRLCRFRGCISDATDGGLCERHSSHDNTTSLNEGGKKKRDLPSGGSINNKEMKKGKRQPNSFVIDLSDVPPQPPIPKSQRRIKEGASKYTGVYFDTWKNKWKAHITIEGKQHYIGNYENEEEAAIDYARAVFKYKMQGGAVTKKKG